jgi:hypothetical protein
MMRLQPSFWIAIACVGLLACGGGNGHQGAGGAGDTEGGSSNDGATTGGESTASSMSAGGSEQLCVDYINKKRATLGLPAYARWSAEESCADGQAQADSQSGTAHSAFGHCGEFAQNECPGWPGPPESMITGCLDMMWAEGPGSDFNAHGHYINMSSTQYTMVACGFYTMADGKTVWAAQDFK